MGYARTAAALLAAATLLAGQPAAANAEDDAAKVRELDIMLMVTSLRCRFGTDDFQADYRDFSARHLPALNAAGQRLRTSLVARHGAKGAARALDRLGTGMANEYGMGHPSLDCAALKRETRQLVGQPSATLAEAAGRLLRRDSQDSGTLLAQR